MANEDERQPLLSAQTSSHSAGNSSTLVQGQANLNNDGNTIDNGSVNSKTYSYGTLYEEHSANRNVQDQDRVRERQRERERGGDLESHPDDLDLDLDLDIDIGLKLQSSLMRQDTDFGSDDLDNFEDPRQWPDSFKWGIVFLLACMAFVVTFTCLSVVPVANQIVSELTPQPQPSHTIFLSTTSSSSSSSSSSTSSALLVTIWELGEAAGPLLIAPLSELFGRYPVMNFANAFFISATLLAALSPSVPLFVTARALTGLAVAVNVLNPAIIGDMFDSNSRGSAMSLVMLAPLVGGAVGPTMSGAIAQSLGWRSVLFLGAGLAVFCEVLFLFFFRETYRMAILRKKRSSLPSITSSSSSSIHESLLLPSPASEEDTMLGKSAYSSVSTLVDVDDEDTKCSTGDSEDESSTGKLWLAIRRPVDVVCGSAVLLSLSLFGAVTYSFFYTLSISLPAILHDIYGLSPALTGSAFMVFSLGSFVAVYVCNHSLDKIYIHLRSQSLSPSHTNPLKPSSLPTPTPTPEYRLPLTIFGALTFPFAITAYGWAAHFHLPLPLLLATVAIIGFTLLLAVIPLSAYVVDAFGPYSASAMTAVIVTRCLMGTFLPLSTGPLVEKMGYGWGMTTYGCLSLGLAPIPMLVMRYGKVWRAKSRFTRCE